MSMCISIAQARTRFRPMFWLFRRLRFTTAMCLFLSYVYFVWQAWHFRDNFEVNVILAWQVQDIGHFSSPWQAWRFLHIAKMFAGVCQNKRWFWMSFFVAGVVFDELWRPFLKGSKVSFCEIVVTFDFGYDDDSVWQAQHFECLRLIIRSRRSTSQTSTEKWLRPR